MVSKDPVIESCYYATYYMENIHRKKQQSAARYKKNHDDRTAYARAYYLENKEKIIEYKKKYRITAAKKIRNWDLKNKFGMTIDQFEEMILLQEGLCAVCGKKMSGGRDACVDHDHKTNRIRGIVHMGCNCMLGAARDNPDILNMGAKYLNFWERINDNAKI